MSRSHLFDTADRPDPIELRSDLERPTRSELADETEFVEPADFDDRRIADRYGEQPAGFFAFELGPDFAGEPF